MYTSIQGLSNGVCHAYNGGQILEKCVPKKVRLSVGRYLYSKNLVRLTNTSLLLVPHVFALFFRSFRTVTKSQKVNKTVFYEGK